MYNAFISYSHGADNIFAPALQDALQNFAKPWYKKRNLEIFRDESNLSASPLLWDNITKALDEAEFLILLASPSSEKSKWVNKEVEYWLQHKSIDTMLFALTEGSMDWDNEHNCFLHLDGNSLPPALDGAFNSEPFYIDMRQAKTEKDLSVDNPIFKKEILKLAAKLHGLQPNDMASEEVTQHRKMMRIRNTAFTLLLCLLLAALAAGFIANHQKNKATMLAGSNIKLAKAFESVYFYADRFALSNSLQGFYFTDKIGDKVKKLGEWEEAEQFNYTGFARVRKLELTGSIFGGDGDLNTGVSDYIIDTSGNFYKSAYDPKRMDSTITALDLADKNLEILPAAVFSNQHLQILLLPNNKLKLLPEAIGNLKNLKKLDLSQNQLTSLPKAIGELKALEILDLHFNNLTALPAAIGQLTNLKELHLLITLNGFLIHNLNLSPIYLSVIPKAIGLLKNLTTLDMGISSDAVLPAEIGNLKGLENLVLFAEDSATIPKEIWNLKDLKLLVLKGIHLDNLPVEIGQFQHLNGLSLSAANLSNLPEELFQLKDLASLSLGDNQLKTLPKQLGNLKNLAMLDFSNNQLTELPAAIGELKQLMFLTLSSNQLTTLPKEISALKRLSSLTLSRNKFSILPKEIGNLDSLRSLYLDGSNLQSLPEEIGNLKMLTTLNLKENKLVSLPKDIGNLASLKSLDLSRNNLHTLPKEMEQLKNLKELTLYDNPLDYGEIIRLKELLPNCDIKH